MASPKEKKGASPERKERSPSLLTEKQVAGLYKLYSNDIEKFVSDFFGDHLSVAVADFHREIYSLLMVEKRLAIAAPRGFAKSYLCSTFYPLHQALFERKKDIYLISASEGLAVQWLRKIRFELENNHCLLAFFGDLRSEKWTETHLVLNNKTKTNIMARGADAQIRGYRPDLIVLDDIEDEETVCNEMRRDKLRKKLFKELIPTMMPHGQLVLIGTIISPLSLLNEILESSQWTKRKYRAYKDGIEEEGHELWPEMWSHKRLQERKAEIGSFAFSSEYMNEPVSDETAPIKQHQIRYWDELPKQYSAVISIDPAYSEEEKADYKVASLVCADVNGSRYLQTYIRTHAPTGEFMDSIINLYLANKDRVVALGVPSSGTEKMFYSSFLKRCSDRRVSPPIVELKNVAYTSDGRSVRNKKNRIITTLQPLFEQGKYYIHKDHVEAKDELLSIGFSRHDDLVDTLAYAEQIIQPGYYTETGDDTPYTQTYSEGKVEFAYGL